MIAGRGGVFDVHLGDDLIYSKQHNNNQFPENEAVLKDLASRGLKPA